MRVAFVLGAGPSMTLDDARAVKHRGIVIALGLSVRLAPWADVAISCDPEFWHVYWPELRHFRGWRLCVRHPDHLPPHGVMDVLPMEPSWDSACHAIRFAHRSMGADYIVLLGCDSRRRGAQAHWHEPHPAPLGNYSPGVESVFAASHERAAEYAREHGITVVNASRESALDCYPRISLEDALAFQSQPPALSGSLSPTRALS